MWAMRRKSRNCTKATFCVQFRPRNWFNIFRNFTTPVPPRPTFSQPGNQTKVARGDDKDLTLASGTCANILRDYGAYMARQNGRGSSRPWVLNRTATSPTQFRVSAPNCLLAVGVLL